MSSGFTSGGTLDAPIERDDAWLAAQKEIETKRAAKAAAASQGTQRSLFETLEANKAAKQEAFEESAKLKNQFRTLDADEIEFLDEVLESTRKEEERVKRETEAGLEAFRKLQEEADKKAGGGAEGQAGEDEWKMDKGRKRKREKKEALVKGVKLRRGSTVDEKHGNVEKLEEDIEIGKAPEKKVKPDDATKEEGKVETPKAASPVPPPPPKAALGLVDYGSDDDDW